MAQVKGTKISSKIAFVKNEHGPETVEAVLGALSPADRESVRRVLELGWYPLELYERVLDAIVATAGRGSQAVLDDIGTYTAEHQAGHAYRVYFRSKDPRKVLEAMVPMHSQLNDPGEMEVVSDGDRHVTIFVRQPSGTLRGCRVARAFYRRSVELCGVEHPRVQEVQCSARDGECCEFEIRW